MRKDPCPHRNKNINIFYEDEALLVCLKPRGVLSAKDASGKCNMADLLAPREIYPVHRLDKEATGLMVFAKTKEAAAFLSAQMAEGFEKEYLARCEGFPPQEGELTDLLYHDRQKNKTYSVKRKRGGVKEARLSYRVLSRDEESSLVSVWLYTGRTHQIRVQFASRGYPLKGDRKYGAKSSGVLQLCSCRLAFRHPQGQLLDFRLPKEFSL